MGFAVCPRKAVRTVRSHSVSREHRKEMVRLGGLELPTFWFVARRSIQLSYRRTVYKYYHKLGVRTKLRLCDSEPRQSRAASVRMVTTSKPAMAHW